MPNASLQRTIWTLSSLWRSCNLTYLQMWRSRCSISPVSISSDTVNGVIVTSALRSAPSNQLHEASRLQASHSISRSASSIQLHFGCKSQQAMLRSSLVSFSPLRGLAPRCAASASASRLPAAAATASELYSSIGRVSFSSCPSSSSSSRIAPSTESRIGLPRGVVFPPTFSFSPSASDVAGLRWWQQQQQQQQSRTPWPGPRSPISISRRAFFSSAPRAPRYRYEVYRRFGPPGGGPRPGPLQHPYGSLILVGVGLGVAFYWYNTETVEVRALIPTV